MPDFQTLLIWVIPVLLAITLHEAAHGWTASKFGDHTARMMGRVTLNPVKHIDPVGTIIVPLALLIMSTGFIFGWAKPVPINFNALRSPKSGMIWVALAGPGANLIMAIGWLFVAILTFNNNIPIMLKMAGAGIFINILLAVFNLLPIPPLDGSRILYHVIPDYWAYKLTQFEAYGFVVIFFLAYFGLLFPIINSMLIPLEAVLL